MGNLFFDDQSGDKKYFTVIPNFIANHSTAVDQALYLQMKRIAGENGYFFGSKRYLMKQMGIGIKALNKSIKYLLKNEWIELAGKKRISTKGGMQEIDCYRILDIWKKNVDHYQGVAKRTPLNPQGVAESFQGVAKRRQGVAESTPNKNINKNINKKEDFLNFLEEKNTKHYGSMEKPEELKNIMANFGKKNLPRRG